MEKTDSLFFKYTKRALINAQMKPTKRIKRLHETQPKHNKHIMTTQKQPGHTTPTTTKRNSNRITPPPTVLINLQHNFTHHHRDIHTPHNTQANTHKLAVWIPANHMFTTQNTQQAHQHQQHNKLH